MAIGVLTYDFERILAFAQSRMPLARQEGMRGIGLERDGQVIASAIYEGFNGANIWVHLAAADGRSWLNRTFLRAGFAYPFAVCGVQKLWGWVDASNVDARRFDEHCGFVQQAVLPGAASDGGDVIVYGMTRAECRFL